MISKSLRRICFLTCGLFTAVAALAPTTKVEARGEAGVAIAAGVGALVGAAIGSDMAHHHHQDHRQCQRQQRCCAGIQQQTMRYVLTNYNPAFHEAWVQYVVVDCSGTLNANQQNQLLEIMHQRRCQLGHRVPVHTVETRTVYHHVR